MNKTDTVKTIVAVGEILWDILPIGAKLGGAVSSLGVDELGKTARDAIVKLGIETSALS